MCRNVVFFLLCRNETKKKNEYKTKTITKTKIKKRKYNNKKSFNEKKKKKNWHIQRGSDFCEAHIFVDMR